MPENGFTASLLRADDLLALTFEFINLQLDAGAGHAPRLVRIQSAAPAFVIVHFPPQHVAEQTFSETTSGVNTVPPPVGSVLAGPSRLVFEVAGSVTAIPFTTDALLNWAPFAPFLAPNADPTILPFEPGPGLADPDVLAAGQSAPFTAIELPYRLILSPGRSEIWEHSIGPVTAIDPVTKATRSELWHTRLARSSDKPSVRAVWARDVPGPLASPFTTPMTSDERTQIARLSADFSISPIEISPTIVESEIEKVLGFKSHRPCYSPPRLAVAKLFLSTLGGWLDTQCAWTFPGEGAIRNQLGLLNLFAQSSSVPALPLLNISSWRHIAGMGRDQYVRVAHEGFLFPFGHRATRITTTERKFTSVASDRVAYLVERQVIVVQEHEKDYRALEGAFAHNGREFPFKRIQITTRITPLLQPPPPGEAPFFPHVGTVPFAFDIVATDLDDQDAHFTLPLLFVPVQEGSNSPPPFDQILPLYLANHALRRAELRGQQVTFAPASGSDARNTALNTTALFFSAQTPAGPRDRAVPFLPVLEKADVSIPAIEHMVKVSGGSGATSISFNDTYLNAGLDGANKGRVFADIRGLLPLNIPADKAGGLAAPNMNIQGLSSVLGPVPDIKNIVAGIFDPTEVFKGITGANLLGGIKLSDIVGRFDIDPTVPADPLGSGPARIPTLTTTRSPVAVDTILHWEPSIQNVLTSTPPPDPLPPIRTHDDTTLALHSVTHTPIDGTNASSVVTGSLTSFSLEFLGIIEVAFKSLTFSAATGKKMDVKAAVADVSFKGDLEFVNDIRHILSPFGDQLAIGVTPEGITAGYSLVIPTLSIGIFSFQDLGLSTSLSIPFIDAPSQMRFAISKREHPFLVTVSLFGGGGFFALTANTRGDIMVEASIEFGGNLELDLVVAKGGVHVMAGIYFKMEGTTVKITGYLRCGGHLEVLGLITVSVEFYMALSYETNGKVLGEATLTVSVDISFFSKSVSLHVERRFAGSAGDPTFDESITPAQWEGYCAAFA
jgi:hypothetical protein